MFRSGRTVTQYAARRIDGAVLARRTSYSDENRDTAPRSQPLCAIQPTQRFVDTRVAASGNGQASKRAVWEDPPTRGTAKFEFITVKLRKHYRAALSLGLAFMGAGAWTVYKVFINPTGAGAPEHQEQRKKRKKVITKDPVHSEDIPEDVPYLLIGGGVTSYTAARAIQSLDPTAKILILSEEGRFPPTIPGDQDLSFEPYESYTECKSLMSQRKGGIAVAKGWKVNRIDARDKTVFLEDNYTIGYDKCLIATESTPLNLPVFEKASDEIQDKVLLYHDMFDSEQLDNIIKRGVKDIAVVGGGSLGSEVACSLARRGKQEGFTVHHIVGGRGVMQQVLPEYLSEHATNQLKAEGVHVIKRSNIERVYQKNDHLVLRLTGGGSISAEHVIVALGSAPNTDLASASGLELDKALGGFKTNAELLARSNLWIAGNCASFFDMKYGRRRVDHYDHAAHSGQIAGENMVGAGKPFTYQAKFSSQLGPGVSYEGIGIVDSTLDTVSVFAKASNNNPETTDKQDYQKGIVFYLYKCYIVGIVLWNLSDLIPVARGVLEQNKSYDEINEVANLFLMPKGLS